jgi:hypothetical protein
MKCLLQDTCKKVSNSKRKKLTNKAYADLLKQHNEIIILGEEELPPVSPKPSGKRGKMA